MRISTQLLFVSDELQSPHVRKEMRIPMEFISFGFIDGRLFSHFRNQGTFIIPNNVKRRWGNDVVYGSLFLLRDFQFYIRLLDAYFLCSKSTLMRNHANDLHHRCIVEATPIGFTSLDDFSRLKYRENEPIAAHAYMGNTNNPKISRRIRNGSDSYRIKDGVVSNAFVNLFREVTENGE